VGVDTHGDAADAATAATRILAQYGNSIAFFVGPGTNESVSVVPIVTGAKIPELTRSGSSQYDSNTSPYLWRMTPPDDLYGAALTAWAHQHGWNRIALVFGNDSDGQANVPGALAAAKFWNMTVTSNIATASGATSYQEEVLKVINGHPQAILEEQNAASAATFFDEYHSLSSGNVPPLVATSAQLTTGFMNAITKALGKQYVSTNFSLVGSFTAGPGVPGTGAAYNTFAAAVKVEPKFLSQYGSLITGDDAVQTEYDFTVLCALAMDKAKSVDPTVWDADVTSVANAQPGAVVVHTYAEGAAALAAGKQIQYVGVTGDVAFNQYHNSYGSWTVQGYNPATGSPTYAGTIDASALNGIIAG
jgi:hypothetical protein